MKKTNSDAKKMVSKDKQQGSVLAVSLVILLILTVLGVNSMSALTLEERMAHHARQSMVASQSAEIALRAAETWLVANVTSEAGITQFLGGGLGLYAQAGDAIPNPLPVGFDIYDDSTWTNLNSVTVVGVAAIDPDGAGPKARSLAQDPQYIIEYLGHFSNAEEKGNKAPVDIINVENSGQRDLAFRITAIGWGENTNARFLAQSTFRIDLN